MIRSISFENYKSFKDRTAIDIKPITVLVGPNGSGKSSIIKLLRLMHQSYLEHDDDSFLKYSGRSVDLEGFSSVVHRGMDGQLSFSISLDAEAIIDFTRGDVTALELPLTVSCRATKTGQELEFDHICFSMDRIGSHLRSEDTFFGKFVERIQPKLPTLRRLLEWGYDREWSDDEILLNLRKMYRVCPVYFSRKGFSFTFQEELDRFEYNWIEAIESDRSLLELFSTGVGNLPQASKELLVQLTQIGIEVDPQLAAAKLLFSDEPDDSLEYLAALCTDSASYGNRRGLSTGAWRYLFYHLETDFFKWINEVQDGFLRSVVDPSLKSGLDRMKFLGPLRPSPMRYYDDNGIESLGIRLDEHGFYYLEEFLANVSKSLANLHADYKLELVSTRSEPHFPKLYTLLFREKSTKHVTNYVDVGFGLSQVIPILFALHSSETGSLLVIEQPELHLHPHAQASLAEEFVGCLFGSPEKASRCKYARYSIMIETHSEHIVRGLQVQVAKGRLSKDDIAVYYVSKNPNGEGFVRALPMDEQGLFTESWPSGFFDQGYLQSVELIAGRN